MPAGLSPQQDTMSASAGSTASGALMSQYQDRNVQLIPISKIKMHTQAISQAFTHIQQSRDIYKHTLHATGDKGKAKAASDQITGGYCKFWDKLCKDGHVVCMVVTCPSAADEDQMKKNESDLRKMIFKLDKNMIQYLLDVYTSRKEIGQTRETTVYCRFPIYMTQSVHNIAAMLRMAKVGSHQFDAFVNFDGRAKICKQPEDHWSNVTIGGRPVQALSAEELANNSWQQLKCDAMIEKLNKHCNDLFFAASRDPAQFTAEMAQYIYQWEIDHIEKMKTFKFAQELIFTKGDAHAKASAMLQFAGEIIHDAEVNLHECKVFDGIYHYPTGTELFLTTGYGTYFITFDNMFKLRMHGTGDGSLLEDEPGILHAAYCIQFNVETHTQTTFSLLRAGLVFVQHCQLNRTRLLGVAELMHQQLSNSACSMAAASAQQEPMCAAAQPPAQEVVRLTPARTLPPQPTAVAALRPVVAPAGPPPDIQLTATADAPVTDDAKHIAPVMDGANAGALVIGGATITEAQNIDAANADALDIDGAKQEAHSIDGANADALVSDGAKPEAQSIDGANNVDPASDAANTAGAVNALGHSSVFCNDVSPELFDWNTL